MDRQSDATEPAPSRFPGRRGGREEPAGGPVFVDVTGRRGRLLRYAGLLAGAGFLGYTAILGVGFGGGTPLAPETLVPGATTDAPAASAGPARPARPGTTPFDGTGAPTPGTAASGLLDRPAADPRHRPTESGPASPGPISGPTGDQAEGRPR